MYRENEGADQTAVHVCFISFNERCHTSQGFEVHSEPFGAMWEFDLQPQHFEIAVT